MAPRAADEKPKRGKNIHGQYYENYPGPDVGLDLPLDPATRQRWLALAEQAGIRTTLSPETRGDFNHQTFQVHTLNQTLAR